MEYGGKEYWDALQNFLDVIVKEGSAGKFTNKGTREAGTDTLFRVVQALEPWGVYMSISLEKIDKDKE